YAQLQRPLDAGGDGSGGEASGNPGRSRGDYSGGSAGGAAEGIKGDANGTSSGNALLASLAAEGAPGAGIDQGPQGGRGAKHAAIHQEARGGACREAVAVGAGQCELSQCREESRYRARQFVCEKRDCERRAANEAHSSGTAGQGVPLSAA